MASQAALAPPDTTTATTTISNSVDIAQAQPHRTDDPTAPSSTPVEMSNLHSQDATPSSAQPSTSIPPPPPELTTSAFPIPLTRHQTEALGPSTEAPIAPPPISAERGPTLSISLMLITGARHPYKIDGKYLKNRKVETTHAPGTPLFDPREMSSYKLKELIWTDWRSEWESRPASPSSIRLIIMGRMLDDKLPLKDYPFSLETTNVVHMTIKPADLIDDEAEAAGKGPGKASIRGRDGEDRGAGCRCVIL